MGPGGVAKQVTSVLSDGDGFLEQNTGRLLAEFELVGQACLSARSLSGSEPEGRYEWFIGVAPADAPRVAIAVLLVQGELWWRSASQIAGEVLRRVFCEDGACRPEAAARWISAAATRPGEGAFSPTVRPSTLH